MYGVIVASGIMLYLNQIIDSGRIVGRPRLPGTAKTSAFVSSALTSGSSFRSCHGAGGSRRRVVSNPTA
jgi:hypothetical protein